MYVSNFESGWNWFHSKPKTRDSKQFTQDGVYLINDQIPSKEIHIPKKVDFFSFSSNPQYTAGAVARFEYVHSLYLNSQRILAIFLMESDGWCMEMSNVERHFSVTFTTSSFTILSHVLPANFFFIFKEDYPLWRREDGKIVVLIIDIKAQYLKKFCFLNWRRFVTVSTEDGAEFTCWVRNDGVT